MEFRFNVKNLSQTVNLAKDVAKYVREYKVVCLRGDLGAGKTTFTKSLLKELGVDDIVSSPTYTIIKQYSTSTLLISHMDLYRLSDAEELREVGFDEVVANSDVVVIEWPDIAKEFLPSKYLNINIVFDDNGDRVFEVRGIDEE